ncbi:MAG: hypothetical protein ACOC85_02725 [Thermoplasmatota archaeon]
MTTTEVLYPCYSTVQWIRLRGDALRKGTVEIVKSRELLEDIR